MSKYKKGDKILVKSIDWYNKNKNAIGTVIVPYHFVSSMYRFCGKMVTIARVINDSSGTMYYIYEDSGEYTWSEEMFEGYPHDVQLGIF